MIQDLIIVGAGGFSRQIAELVEDLNANERCWNLLGFLDDNRDLHQTQVMGYPVLGGLNSAGKYGAAKFVIGIANYRKPESRRVVTDRLGLGLERYTTLVHPSASVSSRAEIGPGTVLLQNVVLSYGVVLRSHVLVSPGCVISHGTLVEDYVTFAANVAVSGECRLGRSAYLGSGSAILENVTVGESAVVGLGATVVADAPPGVTVVGCPAKPLPRPIPLTRPSLDERCAEAARRVILSGWVTQGPEVAQFEREFSTLVGAPHACAVSSCTAALHLALRAAGVGAGDHVITVSHSFIATANAIRLRGATPVLVDIESGGFNMDPSLLTSAVTPRTKAILCVHQIGMPCEMGAILEFARPRSLVVIEDAACAIGSEILWEGDWEKIGKPHGDIACFSFHPRKVITTGEGGMLTTVRDDWDRSFRLWRQHGMDLSDAARHREPQVKYESYPEMGYNYKMTDIQAAIGREQLAALPRIVERRRFLAARYHRLLAAVKGLAPPKEPEWARSNWQSYCVRMEPSCQQRDVMQRLLDRGIATRRGIMCVHREPAAANTVLTPETLARSELAQDSSILLPLYPDMSEADQDRVVEALAEVLG